MRLRAWGLAAAASLLVLSGCSDADSSQPEPAGEASSAAPPAATTSASPSPFAEPTEAESGKAGTPKASATPYLPVPKGVNLTPQGLKIPVGARATVAWEPRKQVVGVLEIRVNRLELASIKQLSAFKLTKAQKGSSLFFVRTTIKNVGKTDLAGVVVPLYLVNGRDVLIQPTTFAATFSPCTAARLPKPFARGDQRRVCLVYLVPDEGRLKSVTFRPTKRYDPIIWSGQVLAPAPDKPKKKSG